MWKGILPGNKMPLAMHLKATALFVGIIHVHFCSVNFILPQCDNEKKQNMKIMIKRWTLLVQQYKFGLKYICSAICSLDYDNRQYISHAIIIIEY